MKKKKLLEQLAALQTQHGELLAKLNDENADVVALKAQSDDIDAQVAKAKQELAAIESLEQRTRENAGRQPAQVHDRREDAPFANLGEQLAAIANTALRGETDPRLRHDLAPSGGSANVPSDVGYAIRPEFVTSLLEQSSTVGILAPRCREIPIGEGSDSIEAPIIDETSRATGSRWGGVQVYRRAEAETVTAKKPKFDKFELRLEDMMGLAYITGRALQDTTSLGAIYGNAFSDEFAFKLDDEIFRGNGAAQCLGLLNSPALVSVAKETGQAAATLVPENIIKMFARMPARNRAKAVWVVNQDIEPQLYTMKFDAGTAGYPAFMPAGSISNAPFGSLLGRPILPIEHAETLGTVGDIMLVDFNEYVLVRKGGVQAATSMHVRFLYDEMAFRWIVRVNGAPKWKSALTPFKGSNTLSPYVALATRA